VPAPRVASTTSSATPTPNSDTTDEFVLTAQAATAAFQPPSGSPVQGQKLWVQLVDDGTARALTWSSATGGYSQNSIVLPSTTVSSTYLNLGFIYTTANSLNKWILVGSTQGTQGVTGPTGSQGVTGPTGPTGRVPTVASTTSSATPTPNATTDDIFELTAQAATAAFQPPSGSPSNGQFMQIRIRVGATGPNRAITWSAATGGYVNSRLPYTASGPAATQLFANVPTANIGIADFRYVTAGSLNKWVLSVSYLATG